VVAKAIDAVLGIAVVAVVIVIALLFLGGSIQPILPPVGPGIDPPGSVYLGLPKDGDLACPDSGDDPCHPSPIPTIDPLVALDGRPLVLPVTTVRLDHVGRYTIPLGTAVLPNGVLTRAEGALDSETYPGLTIEDHAIRLRLVGEDGAYRGNTWNDGWHPGTETVHVQLEFTVSALEAPVSIGIEDILVE
jgi:hypothetical protein